MERNPHASAQGWLGLAVSALGVAKRECEMANGGTPSPFSPRPSFNPIWQRQFVSLEHPCVLQELQPPSKMGWVMWPSLEKQGCA